MGEADAPGARLDVQNVGGIDRTKVSLRPGVTVLVGRNATNRTSLLESLVAACGSTDVSVKSDAEEGRVQLRLDGERYDRTLSRSEDSVAASGSGLLSDPQTAELFAFLLGSNPVRHAVAHGGPLRELLLEPLDTAAIEAEIARLQDRTASVEAELDALDDLASRLPSLEDRRDELDEQIETVHEELTDERERLAAAGIEDEGPPRNGLLRDRLDELSARRAELESVRADLDIEESTVTEVRADIADLEAERKTLSDAPEARLEELDRQIEFVREQKRDAAASMNDLQRIIQFNEEMIDGANIELLEDRVTGEGTDDVDQSVEGGRVVCWTCGTSVGTDAVQSTLDRLRRVREDELRKVRKLEDRLEELEAERDRLERQRQRKAAIDQELDSLRGELAAAERRLERLDTRAEELEAEIADVERAVKRLRNDAQDDIQQRRESITELEFELDELRDEREAVEAERERIESRLAEREDLEIEREALQEAIREQRTRIERTEEEAVEQFNARMDDLVDRLGYDNIERIRVEPTGDGGTGRSLALHVVRTTDAGSTYEDTVDHLSESERAVTGIVFALAGFLAHEVYEDIPFLLLDSLEAIDADRIAELVDYVSDYAAFVVVALLPEDAGALDDEYDRITDI